VIVLDGHAITCQQLRAVVIATEFCRLAVPGYVCAQLLEGRILVFLQFTAVLVMQLAERRKLGGSKTGCPIKPEPDREPRSASMTGFGRACEKPPLDNT
jgi:hypothetical protein